LIARTQPLPASCVYRRRNRIRFKGPLHFYGVAFFLTG
jgi:hypothetical protein